MKEIKSLGTKYLSDFDVEVNPYLTLAQIQQIVNAITKFDTWSEREQNKNMLVLYHATNMGKDELEKIDYDVLHNSGLINAVISQIKNYEDIDKAIKYTESFQRMVVQISKEMPKLTESFNKLMGELDGARDNKRKRTS